jgi:hypothetical protein
MADCDTRFLSVFWLVLASRWRFLASASIYAWGELVGSSPSSFFDLAHAS